MMTPANCSDHGFSRRAAVILVALAWSGLATGGEIHDAARNRDLQKVMALTHKVSTRATVSL
jgi:hypothetical protein